MSSLDNQQVDDEIVADLFTDNYDDLVGFLRKRISDKSEAQDIAQESYLRLLNANRQEIIHQPKSYLFRIAVNLISEFKRRSSYIPLEQHDTEVPARDNPEKSLVAEQSLDGLAKLFDDLPPLYRAIFILRKRDGLSHQEIADKLGVSKHTVHKYLTRALTLVRRALEEDSE